MSQDSLFGTGVSPVFAVSEFLDYANELLSARDVVVQGEVVGAKSHPTGFYFSLKDPQVQAIMDCYMSPYAARNVPVALEDGMLVKVGGVASVYKARGRFSFRVESVELAGEGSLKKAYEALKKKLTEEGLFDRKRPLPEFMGTIGLITSKTGAVIDDFRRNLAPLGLRVLHADARVEGAAAVGQIRAAIERFNRGASELDALVVIRGGGSMEDLQAFNDESVVRAVFGSRVPTIIAIGHDRDVPLAQLAADASASTPTGVAHVINGTWERLTTIGKTAQKLAYSYEAVLASTGADTRSAAHRLAVHLTRIAGRGRELEHALARGIQRVGDRLGRLGQSLESFDRRLESANPERLLRLGYSIVTDDAGGIIRAASQLRHGQIIQTRLAKGTFAAEVKDVSSN